MSKGSYLLYERFSRHEERLFFDRAKEIINEIEEPGDLKKRDPKRHPGGRPFTYPFRSMLLILLLMVYHRKEYREMEAHLNNNPRLLKELGLTRSPSKSTMQRACAKMGIDTLVRVNDTVTARFKKS